MLSFGIFVNGDEVFRLDATRRTKRKTGIVPYITDGGIVIDHRREDGAIALVKKMLDVMTADQIARLEKAVELNTDTRPTAMYALMAKDRIIDFGSFLDMAYQWEEGRHEGARDADVAMISIRVAKRFTTEETHERFDKEYKEATK